MTENVRLSPSGRRVEVVTPSDLTDVIGQSVLAWGNNQVTSSTATRFLEPWFDDATAPTSRVRWLSPFAVDVVFDRLFVRHNTPRGNGNLIVYTLEVADVATALSVSVASTAASGSNVVDTALVPAGSDVSMVVEKAVGVGQSPLDILATCRVRAA